MIFFCLKGSSLNFYSHIRKENHELMYLQNLSVAHQVNIYINVEKSFL